MHHRMKRYLISMSVRTVCFILAVVLHGWLRWTMAAAAIVLPYVAVVMANAGPRRGVRAASAYSPEVMELLSPLFEARAEYLTAAFETIEETWGDVDTYLEQGLGLTPELRGLLRERLLD